MYSFPHSFSDDDEAVEENLLTELHRVSFTIENLDHDTSVVPADAYILNDRHQVVPWAEYRGLAYSELSDLNSYAHFRPAKNVRIIFGFLVWSAL